MPPRNMILLFGAMFKIAAAILNALMMPRGLVFMWVFVRKTGETKTYLGCMVFRRRKSDILWNEIEVISLLLTCHDEAQ